VPDVSCDFSAVKLEHLGPNRIGVSGVRGLPPTSTYKVCTIHRRGWRAAVVQPILGLEAAAKAERQAAALIERTRRMLRMEGLGDWTTTHVELLGTEACFGAQGRYRNAREVLCRIVVEHGDKRATEIFAREQIMAIMAMSVGTTIGIGTAVTPVQELFSFLLDKTATEATLTIDGVKQVVAVNTSGDFGPELIARPPAPAQPDLSGKLESVPLIGLAWARSGDKGDLFNVGVISRVAEFLPYIAAALTPAAVAQWYAHVFSKSTTPRVERFDLPGTHAINFVLHNALAGGITSSPRLDSVAKGMAQQLLSFPVPVPAAIAAKIDRSLLDFDAKPFTGAI
jgi:hypothetical protein